MGLILDLPVPLLLGCEWPGFQEALQQLKATPHQQIQPTPAAHLTEDDTAIAKGSAESESPLNLLSSVCQQVTWDAQFG